MVSSHNPDSEEIARAGPELDGWHVPDDLDREIWGGTRSLAPVPIALKDTGSSSYVLFSACKSTETAKEVLRRGYFSKALLDLLHSLGTDRILCSQIIERLQKEIRG